MKKIRSLKYLVVLSTLFACFLYFDVVKAETEIIRNFTSVIAIQKSGTIFVTENILYDFGSNQRHGIFRNIPLESNNGPYLNIELLGISNELGQPYKYTTSLADNIMQIKIGDPGQYVSGMHTYVISYQVNNTIRMFGDHSELYWNVTGNSWPVSIQDANAVVRIMDTTTTSYGTNCFTGSQGEVQKHCIISQEDNSVNYVLTQPLAASEGLTVVFGLPPGYGGQGVPASVSRVNLPPSSPNQAFQLLFFPHLYLFLIYGVMVLFSRKRKRRIPKPVIPHELKGRPITVCYNPPNHLSPIDVGTILDRQVDLTDISAVIIDLAIRNYLKIRYIVDEIPFWPDKKDFEIVKLREGSDLSHPADKKIFDLLFSGRNKVKLSDLESQNIQFQKDIKYIQNETERHLSNQDYFDREAAQQLKRFKLGLSVLVFTIFIIILFFINQSSFFTLFVTILFGLLGIFYIIVDARLDHKLSTQGIAALNIILGFKEFLELTEKDKLNLLNAPELNPEMFEKFLPYAMVLGVEKKWAKKFEGLYNSVPNWYEDPTSRTISSLMLANRFAFFSASFNHVFNITAPRSSSGLGGGGFSGGGSGGGGGGSW